MGAQKPWVKVNFGRSGARRSTSGEDSSSDCDHPASLEVGAEIRVVVQGSEAAQKPAWSTYALENRSWPACSLGSGFWAGTAKECKC